MELEGFYLKDESQWYNRRPSWNIFRNELGSVPLATIRLAYGRLRISVLLPDGTVKMIWEDYPGDLDGDHHFTGEVSRDKHLTRGLKALQFYLDAEANGWEDEENA